MTGVAENYVYHYIYIDPELFSANMGEKPEDNAVAADCMSKDKDTSGDIGRTPEAYGVSTVMFTADMRDRFNSMIETLNNIILVLIISAGGLAFVVLYNLTNINVTERKREVATIKVLGFFDREVSAYIYRETSLLTIIGCVSGLVLGVFMHAYVVQTVEVNSVMFGRNIHFFSASVI